jgi:outer membrane protein TolC
MANRRTQWCLAGMLLCVGGTGTPAEPELTITQAVQLALANSPDLQAAEQRLQAAQARVEMARSRYFPQVSFNGIAKLGLAGATNGLGLLGLPASPFYRNLAEAGNVNQDIFDFGRTRHATAVGRAEAEAAKQELAETRLRVAEQAKVAFLRVLSAQRVSQVRQQGLRERQGVERKTQEFFQAGLSSKLDANLAEVGLRGAELAVAQARDDEQAAWAALFAALGRPEGTHYDLVEPQFTLAPPDHLTSEIDQALVTRPDLRALQAELEAQQQRVEYAQSLRRPVLLGVFSGGYARFAELTAAQLMAGGLGLVAPLYTGGGLEAQVKAERHTLDALRARYACRVLEVRVEVSRAHAELLKALDSAQANQQIAAYAEEALRLAQTRYRAQLTSFVELLTAEASTEQARAEYAQAVYNYQISRAHLNTAVGLEP